MSGLPHPELHIPRDFGRKMSRQIFREAALKRLASPEQIDRTSRLVRPRAWIAFLLLFISTLATASWALVARAPIKVTGQGILFEEGLLMDVIAALPGRIASLSLETSAPVRIGDKIAELGRPDLELDMAKTRADLADAQSRLREIELFQKDSESREIAGEDARLETIRASQGYVARRVTLLEIKIASVQNLLKRNLVVRDRLIEAELELSTARERIAQFEDETRQVALRRLERQSKTRLALLDEQLKVNELERRLRRQESQLLDEQAIRSAHDGRVAEIKVSVGDVVTPGTPLATLIREEKGTAGAIALIYISPRDGRRIRKGMAAEIVPSVTLREEFGFIVGEVEDVSDVPATAQGMRAILKNEQLANKLAGEGAPLAVRVRLETDPTTATGLRWSSSKGPPRKIPTGTLLTGAVIVERVPVISLLAPGLDGLLGLAER